MLVWRSTLCCPLALLDTCCLLNVWESSIDARGTAFFDSSKRFRASVRRLKVFCWFRRASSPLVEEVQVTLEVCYAQLSDSLPDISNAFAFLNALEVPSTAETSLGLMIWVGVEWNFNINQAFLRLNNASPLITQIDWSLVHLLLSCREQELLSLSSSADTVALLMVSSPLRCTPFLSVFRLERRGRDGSFFQSLFLFFYLFLKKMNMLIVLDCVELASLRFLHIVTLWTGTSMPYWDLLPASSSSTKGIYLRKNLRWLGLNAISKSDCLAAAAPALWRVVWADSSSGGCLALGDIESHMVLWCD